MPLLLNADLGEIEDCEHKIEHALIPLIDMANIACGFHAGTPTTIANTLQIASRHQVRIGSHPGYGDKENFGRISIPHTAEELVSLIHYQTAALEGMAALQGLAVEYVKPHGALYNDMIGDSAIRKAVLKALGHLPGSRRLMILASREWENHRREASRYGVDLIFEAFADRAYDRTGRLASRQEPGAVLNHSAMLEQVDQLVRDNTVTTRDGERITLNIDTLCVHGDSPDALAAIGDIRRLLNR
jgi:5-oxoprolinase (ATP-hydrolysing) subunit A